MSLRTGRMVVAALSVFASLTVTHPAMADICGELTQSASASTQFPEIAILIDRLNSGDNRAARGLATKVIRFRDQMQEEIAPPSDATLRRAQAFDQYLLSSLSPNNLPDDLMSAWARYRLLYVIALNRVDCIGLAIRLLEETHTWPMRDQAVTGSLVASLTGAYILAGGQAELDRAREITLDWLENSPTPASLDDIRVRVASMSNLAVALRQSGMRPEARNLYQRALALVDNPDSQRLVDRETIERKRAFWEELAAVEINLAALALFEQHRVIENKDSYKATAGAHLEKAKTLLERAGAEKGRTAVDMLRVSSDLALENQDREAARQILERALALAEQIASTEQSLISELRRRLASVSRTQPDLIPSLLARETELANGMETTGIDMRHNALALLDAYSEQGNWPEAVRWGLLALDRFAKTSGGPTIERAIAEQKLSFAYANLGDYQAAFHVSKESIATLRGLAAKEAVGCSIGAELNPHMLRTIREWHGMVTSILLQSTALSGTPLADLAANEVFSLIQDQEVDRFGASAFRATLRSRGGMNATIEKFDSAMAKKCRLEAQIATLAAQGREATGKLSSVVDNLKAQEHSLAKLMAELDPVARGLITGGRLTLERDDLNKLLNTGEAIIGFQFGDSFSVASLSIKTSEGLTTASIPLPKAPLARISELVSAMMTEIETEAAFGPAAIEFSERLRLEEIKPLLARADHVFVVADGPLRRLPSHLLPLGSLRLGDIAPVSTLPSTWAFALRRQFGSQNIRNRMIYTVGDPSLNPVPCDLIDSVDKDHPHREVMCLGMASELTDLLKGAQTLLGGPPPLLRDSATRRAVLGGAPKTAGILLFGTHGVLPSSGEINDLHEPALVLTPNRADPSENGLLLASEIAEMRWDNSWLAILAACRTGSPNDNEISEGLAGFALAFTNAGVEALIVTQWAVPANEASKTVLSMLRRMAADSTLTLAKALELGMQEQRARSPILESWAGFTILGDGSLTMPRD